MEWISNGIGEIGHRQLRPARFKVELPSYPDIAGNSASPETPTVTVTDTATGISVTPTSEQKPTLSARFPLGQLYFEFRQPLCRACGAFGQFTFLPTLTPALQPASVHTRMQFQCLVSIQESERVIAADVLSERARVVQGSGAQGEVEGIFETGIFEAPRVRVTTYDEMARRGGGWRGNGRSGRPGTIVGRR
ncbi:hypothetical protein PABG_05100 [Paracoccidioides brasiliensis Pb03]|nr:hypothetical protein PABG_05100 [Paracoccidioides brasiliensis Pb03]